jgi:hypothetical protein
MGDKARLPPGSTEYSAEAKCTPIQLSALLFAFAIMISRVP